MLKKEVPEISVVIPVYNGARTLDACLSSVLAQAYKSFEILVVDNASSDKTKEIIERYVLRDERVQYVYEPFRSRGAARNKGIKNARGEIIVMTDADCIVPENWLLLLTKPIRYQSERIVMGLHTDKGNNVTTRYRNTEYTRHFNQYVNGQYINILDTKNCAIHKNVFEGDTFDGEMRNAEDYEFSLRVRKQYKIRYVPHVVVTHIYKDTIIKWAVHNLNRAYWVSKVYRKHNHDYLSQNDPLFEHVKGVRWLRLIIFVALTLRNRHLLDSLYYGFTGLAWRIGIVGEKLHRLLQNSVAVITTYISGSLQIPFQQSPLVSIIIIVHNQLWFTRTCIQTIIKHTDLPYELILVDNGSGKPTKKILRTIHNAIIITNESNENFPNAANKGAHHARGKYIVFLNNDIRVTRLWLEPLIETLRNNDNVGIVGPQLVYFDGTLQSAGGRITQKHTIEHRGQFKNPKTLRYNKAQVADWLCGACIAMKKTLFKAVDGFDIGYEPMYYEDVDLCYKIKKRGLLVFYQPRSAVYHYEQGSSDPKTVQKNMVKNEKVFLKKWKNFMHEEFVNKQSS